jgi:hypothetical protein
LEISSQDAVGREPLDHILDRSHDPGARLLYTLLNHGYLAEPAPHALEPLI